MAMVAGPLTSIASFWSIMASLRFCFVSAHGQAGRAPARASQGIIAVVEVTVLGPKVYHRRADLQRLGLPGLEGFQTLLMLSQNHFCSFRELARALIILFSVCWGNPWAAQTLARHSFNVSTSSLFASLSLSTSARRAGAWAISAASAC